jgi:hypothetical protein
MVWPYIKARINTRLVRGSAANSCTNDKSVDADRRFRADDEAIRAKTTIFSKPFAAGGGEPKMLT